MTNSENVASAERADDNEGMQVIAIRLQRSLLQSLRRIAKDEGLPYQTYLRKVVWDHVARKEKNARCRDGEGKRKKE